MSQCYRIPFCWVLTLHPYQILPPIPLVPVFRIMTSLLFRDDSRRAEWELSRPRLSRTPAITDEYFVHYKSLGDVPGS